jgi:hypothetical protein
VCVFREKHQRGARNSGVWGWGGGKGGGFVWGCGAVGLWGCGCVGVWVCGGVGVWMCGGVGVVCRLDDTDM